MKTKGLFYCWALTLFAAGPAHATEQIKDTIVLDGGAHDLLNFPLGDATKREFQDPKAVAR